jgi:serine/threonine-protein kinase
VDAFGTLNAALGGRYEITREIGAGGMATVYLARDVRHDRHVAVKVLHPDLAAVIGVERFLAEIKTTANLQHAHILGLIDSGEVDGTVFYVMPFVDGESLRKRLDREKQLPVDEAVRLGITVCGALEYAHSHHVIHRDLKPDNILIQAGQPVIADFGIALAVTNAGGTRITQSGISLGSPQYMSPEQATADRQIDGRTDIYSLATLLFEMLAGDPPYTASTAQAVIAKVINDRPANIRASRPAVPEHVASAIEKGLEKLPADRWSTAGEFAEALSGARASPPSPKSRPSARSSLSAQRWCTSASAPMPAAIWRRRLLFAFRSRRRDDRRGCVMTTCAWRIRDEPLWFTVLVPGHLTVRSSPRSPTAGSWPRGDRRPPGVRYLFPSLTALEERPIDGTEDAAHPFCRRTADGSDSSRSKAEEGCQPWVPWKLADRTFRFGGT